MNKTKRKLNLSSILLFYIIPIAFLTVFSILILGYIEYYLITIFGFINTYIFSKNSNFNLVKCFFAGFLIPGFSLSIIQIIYSHNIISNPFIVIILFVFLSVFLLFIFINKLNLSSKINFIILIIFSLFFVYEAIKLKDYYPNETLDLKKVSFKVRDMDNNLLSDKVIEITKERRPLFSMIEIHKVKSLVTDENGEFEIMLSEKVNYWFSLERDFTQEIYISSKDLKKKNYFYLEYKKK